MKQRYSLSLLLLISIATAAVAQECANGRYEQVLFTELTETTAVAFGSNTGVSGAAQVLRMDVYEPSGDLLTERPVVLVAFGGSFISGTRADVADICRQFARRGYVAVACDYRVGFFFPTELSTTQAVMRGAHDMKACVRYLRKTVAELGNPYGIDTTRIIVGGVSAGAISAIHATYLNTDDEIPEVLESLSAQLGGVEGNSGNPEYSSEVLACYSLSGAIGDTTWVLANDKPLCSVHEVGDGVVPYYTQQVSVVGIPTGLLASGSHDLHLRFANLDVPNCLLSYPGNGHVGYLNSDPVGSLGFVFDFTADMVCGRPVDCGDIISGVTPVDAPSVLAVTPNPTNGLFSVTVEAAGQITVLDLTGRQVLSTKVTPGTTRMDIQSFANGIYMVVANNDRSTAVRIIKAD